jgi:pimeloyl-ACP methyl ester carboxylesterase
MNRNVDLDVPVDTVTGLPGARLKVTVWLPDALAERPVICFAFPGGGYSRQYWSFDLSGKNGEGEVGYHLDRGWVMVTVDHLGVGESTVPDGPISLETIAAANNAAVQEIAGRLAEGTLVDGFPAASGATLLGFGQSMGGQFLTVLQAHHSPFQGIGILGWSAIHTVVPSRPGTTPLPFPWIARSTFGDSPVVLNGDPVSDDQLLGQSDIGENPLQWAFHFDDESPEMVAADMAGEPMPPWRSATVPQCALLGVAPGVVATEAAAITVPVFLGVGERDVVPAPRMEPFAYSSATDITVFICPRMAHMHNFASTRELLWKQLHHWGSRRAT